MSDTVPARLARLCSALLVYDITASIAFYRDKLRFRVVRTEGDPPEFAVVARDDCRLYLKRADVLFETHNRIHVPGNWFYDAIFTANGPAAVDALYDEFVSAGVRDIDPPHTEFGMRVFNFQDPDGYKFWVHAMISKL